MNAKELHDLYAPLWAAVPETRPINVRLHTAGWFEQYPHPTVNNAQAFTSLTDTTLAALCRVAVEDWIISQPEYCNGIGMFSIGQHERAVVLEGRRMRPSDSFTGPTIHHALVAAALAVAKAKPV